MKKCTRILGLIFLGIMIVTDLQLVGANSNFVHVHNENQKLILGRRLFGPLCFSKPAAQSECVTVTRYTYESATSKLLLFGIAGAVLAAVCQVGSQNQSAGIIPVGASAGLGISLLDNYVSTGNPLKRAVKQGTIIFLPEDNTVVQDIDQLPKERSLFLVRSNPVISGAIAMVNMKPGNEKKYPWGLMSITATKELETMQSLAARIIEDNTTTSQEKFSSLAEKEFERVFAN